MKPKRYNPFIPKEAYHDALNWMQALAEGKEPEEDEPEELDFYND